VTPEVTASPGATSARDALVGTNRTAADVEIAGAPASLAHTGVASLWRPLVLAIALVMMGAGLRLMSRPSGAGHQTHD
jgi:hypothetical protein